jgi:hypothetical protein
MSEKLIHRIMGKGYGNQRHPQRHFAKKIRQFAAVILRTI